MQFDVRQKNVLYVSHSELFFPQGFAVRDEGKSKMKFQYRLSTAKNIEILLYGAVWSLS